MPAGSSLRESGVGPTLGAQASACCVGYRRATCAAWMAALAEVCDICQLRLHPQKLSQLHLLPTLRQEINIACILPACRATLPTKSMMPPSQSPSPVTATALRRGGATRGVRKQKRCKLRPSPSSPEACTLCHPCTALLLVHCPPICPSLPPFVYLPCRQPHPLRERAPPQFEALLGAYA
jgi:hypothetical protein